MRRGRLGSPYIFDGGPAVVDGDREFELWAKTIVNVDDLDTNIVANAATPRLLRREASKDPPSTVHVEVHGHASFLSWRIHSHVDMAGRIGDGNLDILDFVYVRTLERVFSRRQKV